MNRKLILVAAVVLSGVLLFPTVAAQFGDGDRVHPDLVLRPHSGPNGDYAVMADTRGGSDEELALRFTESNPNVTGDGVNPDAVTPFDNVFTITYTGEQSAEVWLTSNVDGLSFYRGTNPDTSLEGRDDSVVLAPGQTLEVGVMIDTTGGTVPSGDTFTVHARIAESATQTTDTPQPTSGDGGGSDGFNIAVATPTPTPDETPTATEPPTIAGGGSGGGGTPTPTVRGGGPDIIVTSVSVSSRTVAPGESVTVAATVENVGSVSGTEDIQLFVNGTQVATQRVTLAPNESQSVSFTTSFNTTGEYNLRVEETDAGTVSVQRVQMAQGTTATATVTPFTTADAAQEPGPDSEQRSGFPWLLVLLALLALVVITAGYWTVQYAGRE